MPNVTQNWLLYNSIYLVLSFPFVWKACLQQSGSRRNEPLWMVSFTKLPSPSCWLISSPHTVPGLRSPIYRPLACMVRRPERERQQVADGLSRRSWGTSLAALLQGSRLHAQTRILRLLNPAIVNVVFIAVMLMVRCSAEPRRPKTELTVHLQAVGGMAAVAGWACIKYNLGVDAYEQLDVALDEAISGNFDSVGGADTVLAAIPRADVLVHEMAIHWYHFELPFGVCMSFALLAAVVRITSSTSGLR